MRKFKINKKSIALIIVTTIITIGSFFGHSLYVKAEEKQTEIDNLTSLYYNVFTSDNQTEIKEDLTKEIVEETLHAHKTIENKYESVDFNRQRNTLIKQFENQQALIIALDEIKASDYEETTIQLDVTNESFENIERLLNQPMNKHLNQSVKEDVTLLKDQFNYNNDIETALIGLYDDSNNLKELDENSWSILEEKINAIQNNTLKEDFMVQEEKAKTEWTLRRDKRLAEEKDRKEKEEAEKRAEAERLQKEEDAKKVKKNETSKNQAVISSEKTETKTQSTSSKNTEPKSEEKSTATSIQSVPKTETKPDEQKASTPVQTNGFNFNGQHFPIKSFSGTGHVPANTPNVYQWTSRPSHYLVERISPAGNIVHQLGVGSTVTVNGQTYTIFHVEPYVPNDNNAANILNKVNASITFQTCLEDNSDGRSPLKIWYAR